MKKLLTLVCLGLALPVLASTNSVPHIYPSGAKIAFRLGNDLYETLPEKFRHYIHPQPIDLESMETPIIMPMANTDGNRPLGKVFISVGFIDLLNHIAHAKAIDHIQPGYFQQYVMNLGKDTSDDALPKLPKMLDPRFWTEDVLNDQMSNFNQMLGMLVAINLSHHYLGHYAKFSGQMLGSKLAPINNFLDQAEWDVAVRAATLDCLENAVATDGAKALFEAIDNLPIQPKRPAWTKYIVPPSVDLKKLNLQLAEYEGQFRVGGLK